LNALADGAGDDTLRFRAGMTAVNVLAIALRYEEAYARLYQMLDLLPTVADRKARQQGLNVAAFLYERAGQYDLSLKYADEQLATESHGNGGCTARNQRLQSLYRSGKLDAFAREYQAGIDACEEVGEALWSNRIRIYAANYHLVQGRGREAIELLKNHADEVRRTHYAELISTFDSMLARASWTTGDAQAARVYANDAVAESIKGEYSEALVDAYQVLYEVSKQQGAYADALAYHEKYAAADKGYLNDTSARALAYQMVSQQVLDKKRQIDALNEKNQMLELRRTVDAKSAEATRLYMLLLLIVLASIALWAYRTKRAQLRFMRLARRDGLTGIANRQHFLETAGNALRYAEKSMRDVCVVVIDLDNFKQVNDVRGHAIGDLVLKCAVQACEARLRSVDVFGRLGGEEFGIVLPDCALDVAKQRAEELRAAIAALSAVDARIDFPVSASFGVATTLHGGYDLRELLVQADVALYEAKRAGRNRVCAHRPDEAPDCAAGISGA
jgi:diguanylate cyclase (GGDEF)-like protein